jgi:hypothetical protein
LQELSYTIVWNLAKNRIPDEEELLKRKELHQGKVISFPLKQVS